MNDRSLPLGIFDSGVGGLTVLKALKEKLPLESFIYYADTAHVPYGNKAPEIVQSYVQEIFAFLLEKRVKAIIMGCNFSSCIALEWAHKHFDIPVFGLVEEACEEALRTTKTGHIGIICTPATAATKGYERALRKKRADLHIITVPCSPFVPLIEAGQIKGEKTKAIVTKTLKELLHHEKLDTIIYGCSHYPFLSSVLKELFPAVTFVDPAQALASFLEKLFRHFDWTGDNQGEVTYYASGSPRSLYEVGAQFLGEDIPYVLPAVTGVPA